MPQLGDTVLYTLTPEDVLTINARRFTATALTGTPPLAGDTYAALIVAVDNQNPDILNLQILLDGNDNHWVQAATPGTGPGHWKHH